MRMFFAVSAIATSLITTGCSSFKASSGNSQIMDIKERAIIAGDTENKVRICAESSPDAMSAMAMEFSGKGETASKVSVGVSAALQESAGFVGLRTTSIQLLRDFGYRLCEAYMSNGINGQQYDLLMRRFQKNVVALLAIEQLTGAVKAPTVVLTSKGRAETSQSLSDQRDYREKLSKKIDNLEKEKKAKETEKADLLKNTPTADTKDLDSLIFAKDAEIKRRQGDLEAIDKDIANTRWLLAEGKTEAKTEFDTPPTQISDAAIAKIADTVGQIANGIVLSNDVAQECLITLQSDDGKNSQDFKDLCKTILLELAKTPGGLNLYNVTQPPTLMTVPKPNQ